MLAKVQSSTVLGVQGHPVRVEVHVAQGLPSFTIVGLPDASCRESRDRVRAAVQSSRFDWPQRRVTVNLAPTNLRKVGSGLDLAIAVGFLVATKQLPQRATEGHGYVGELGLDGSVRSVPGVLPALDAFVVDMPVVALSDLAEARLLRPDAVGVESLAQLVAVLRGEDRWPEPPTPTAVTLGPRDKDLSEVQGHVVARAALEVAAAGAHHLLLSGPPGAGKTMLAERLVGILPDLDDRSAIEVSRVHSVASQLRAEHGLPTRPPFRSPHHTASLVAMVGGGSGMLRPGEISLASGRVELAPMSKRAAVYCRISKDAGGDMLGVQRQEKACRALCEDRAWSVDAVFVDDDRSAYSGKPRPQYEALLRHVRAGGADVLVAWAPDRLTRSTKELEVLIDTVEAANVEIATVQSGLYDLSTPSGRMSARVVGAVARYESEHKSARLKSKAAELAAHGAVGGGGDRPFGYEADRLTVRESEAQRIREAAERVLAGESVRAICTDWTAQRVETVSGKPWRVTTLRRILTAPRTAGLRQHQGQAVGPAQWPAILDSTTHNRLRALLLDPERRVTKSSARSYLLTGYLRCGRCGEKLIARPKAPGRRNYVCGKPPATNGCGKLSALAEPVEDLVTAMVLEAIDTGALSSVADAESNGDLTAAPCESEAARLSAELDALADDYAAGELTRDAYKKAAARLDARLADSRRELVVDTEKQRRANLLADGEVLEERWESMSLDQRRAVIDAVVDAVTVQPAVRGRNVFDPDRVSITWRA